MMQPFVLGPYVVIVILDSNDSTKSQTYQDKGVWQECKMNRKIFMDLRI